ncbi:MAG: triose-phosphate isomerase [Halobacteriovoraceae bacterium]|nr:triose-phosphate isomerase [Halobacteriovoraceae bacterium]
MRYMVGNWKMNQNTSQIRDFMQQVKSQSPDCKGWIAPQFLHIPLIQELKGKNIKVGAQNCSHKSSGAYTGEVSIEALKDLGVDFVLVGHSERRLLFREEDHIINQKLLLAQEYNITAIFCVGETLEQRKAGNTTDIIKGQLDKGLINHSMNNLIIAYEPVWAIGTGKTATPQEAQEVHAFIRAHLVENKKITPQNLSILYGGSVKPGNIEELLAMRDIDGGLVGGASLQADDFLKLCRNI